MYAINLPYHAFLDEVHHVTLLLFGTLRRSHTLRPCLLRWLLPRCLAFLVNVDYVVLHHTNDVVLVLI